MKSSKSAFAAHVSKTALDELAGEQYFERGLAYFRNGAVSRLEATSNEIAAYVSGTRLYTVKLRIVRGKLAWNCSCPLGAEGEFCKHLVATGLAWLAHGSPAARSSPELQSAKDFVAAADKETLANIVLRWAERDDRLLAELLSTAQRGGMGDPTAVKNVIRTVFRARDFIEYDEMQSFVERVEAVPEMLEHTLEGGNAKAAAELAVYAMQHGLNTLQHCDDSDGLLGAVLSGIADVHRQAAHAGAYEPVDLARTLLDLQLRDNFDFFFLDDYRTALGPGGWSEYKRLATEKWKKLRPLKPGSSDERHADHRAQLTEIMTLLARHDNDVDGLIKVLERDLSAPDSYLKIVHACADAGRYDEALRWAEDGKKVFKAAPYHPFHDFLVEEYQRRGQHDKALTLCWERFTQAPSLRSYQELEQGATRMRTWPSWREKAISWLREPRTRKTGAAHHAWGFSSGSLLVEIFLLENDSVAALEAARALDCTESLWLQLARTLETSHSHEAISIYQPRIDPLVRMANNDAYDRAAELLARLRKLMLSAGQRGEFVTYTAELRLKHKAKRNFMKRLDRVLG